MSHTHTQTLKFKITLTGYDLYILLATITFMNVYRIFTTERNYAVFGYCLILSVTVIANNEQEALDLVEKEHGDNFVGSKDKREIKVVCENINKATVVSVEYDYRDQ